MSDRMRELLYKSFESELSALEQAMLDRALAESDQLRAEKSDIEQLRAALVEQTPEGFGLGFVERVMGRLKKRTFGLEGSLLEGLRASFRWVMAATVPVLIALALWNFKLVDKPTAPSPDAVVLWQTPLEQLLENES